MITDNTNSLTATDKVYLDGGLNYDPSWALMFIKTRTSLAGGSGSLLDLACGDGFWSEILANWYNVTGEDISQGGIYMANKTAGEKDLNIEYRLVDSLTQTDQFDVVFARGPSFWSNRSPDHEDFSHALNVILPRVKKKLVYVTYSLAPFSNSNETGSSYYHDPEILKKLFEPYGRTNVSFADSYIVLEVIKDL